MCIAGSANKGKSIIAQPFMPFIADKEWNHYLKSLENLCEKLRNNPKYVIDEANDRISAQRNQQLYDLYIQKLSDSIFRKRPNNPLDTLTNGKKTFSAHSISQQAEALLKIHDVFGRVSSGCDLTQIGGTGRAAATFISSSVSNWKKNYSDVRIIDTSAAGLHEQVSPNLLTFL